MSLAHGNHKNLKKDSRKGAKAQSSEGLQKSLRLCAFA
jgi:hypothetical protein